MQRGAARKDYLGGFGTGWTWRSWYKVMSGVAVVARCSSEGEISELLPTFCSAGLQISALFGERR